MLRLKQGVTIEQLQLALYGTLDFIDDEEEVLGFKLLSRGITNYHRGFINDFNWILQYPTLEEDGSMNFTPRYVLGEDFVKLFEEVDIDDSAEKGNDD